ncbi:MAG: bicyclomycin resistance protein [Rubrivivax sp.]|nr:bicyclomycin resistance protein [Rubrivivax sp.]
MNEPPARSRVRVPAALALGAATRAFARSGPSRSAGAAPKTLRVALPVTVGGLDPVRPSDGYAQDVAAHIFEPLYNYDPLAPGARLVPLTAAAMPEHSADFRQWTIRLQPGIRFADDPAFGGRPRELVAADYVYALQRIADPRNASLLWGNVEPLRIRGLAAARQRALEAKRPFDYDARIEGLRALDRSTLRIELEAPRPRLPYALVAPSRGAQAREVVERYGDALPEHPVGTGAYRLAEWRRASRMVLERNPAFREMRWAAQPAEDDAQGQAIAARLAGRALPLADRVEISFIEEDQPRWLAFLEGGLDVIEVPGEFASLAMPHGELAPYLAARGVHAWRYAEPGASRTMFNLDDPVLGGLQPERIALRRALALALDGPREIRLLQGGSAAVAHSPVYPGCSGYDAGFASEMGEHSPAKAKALLDLHGYTDRDGDGWRERPDGTPLEVTMATQPEQRSRRLDELMKLAFDAIGVRLRFAPAKFAENVKAARAGRLSMWTYRLVAASPDGLGALTPWYGPASGGANLARFRLSAFDALYERLDELPDGPEREALFVQAKKLAVAYMPYKVRWHRIACELAQPWVRGYRRNPFRFDWYQWVDVERQDPR